MNKFLFSFLMEKDLLHRTQNLEVTKPKTEENQNILAQILHKDYFERKAIKYQIKILPSPIYLKS